LFVVADRVGLLDQLADMIGEAGAITVFAPSNNAFDNLPASLQQQLLGRHDDGPCVTSKYSVLTPADID